MRHGPLEGPPTLWVVHILLQKSHIVTNEKLKIEPFFSGRCGQEECTEIDDEISTVKKCARANFSVAARSKVFYQLPFQGMIIIKKSAFILGSICFLDILFGKGQNYK